ncbi:SDR family NAD(P)-dependent oxidoreductase [Ktedonosporobacter rubrisoli]|uniref:SDR family NAD(P)-dependent oxidoreductase n=1 Tax=Ktedonosporobacter rubrisoli TaxID=2509675 RepID=A0A4P6K1V7_KTERU|nr:SDR family NAD(P)-dependent oxidoreductase [Ktedonosporobacter rubrisoli]QBD81456.1 SDR family NAD(P)-dependent oxidoreductase [Ktedonosporobacter rubrisoli]
MRVLVTGGAGFIGSHIVDQYIAAGHEVAIIDNLWEEGGGKQTNLNPKARFYRADITDEASLTQIFSEIQPEIVSHQAAQHSVAVSTKNPQLDARVNVLGLLNVLGNCVRVGTRKIIFASSGATYGTPASLPLNEEVVQRPESPYGITKMVAEHYLRYWQEAYGLTYTALRYGNVYGPRQDPNGEAGVIAIFAKRFLAHEKVRIDWDGGQSKDYVYVEDVARANLLAAGKGDNEIFCIGTGKATSVNEIFQTLQALTGYTPEIIKAPKRPGDIYMAYFDSSKAARLLGWQPTKSFEEGVKATVDFFRQ